MIFGNQSLHGKHPDLADQIVMSAEVDLVAPKRPSVTDLLNVIGVDSPFHASFGYYADPVDATTAVLPRGWKNRLVHLPPGDTGGIKGLCLDPHDLAIAKYVARREKDRMFTRELARRGLVAQSRLLASLERTPVRVETRDRIRADIMDDFGASGRIASSRGDQR
ncbi:DUF6036 family nucleotidyltransferase [Reyranella sp.]|uniref:DUF6036 family nucleotidyltransferase n=1 Tax=Reyranella sp. TaxID=1929291 RepID=UPI003D0FD729